MIATIDIMGKKISAEGDTPREAIANLVYSGFARSKALLTVGEKTIILTAVQAMKLFSKNRLMREIALKQTALRF